MSAAKKPPVRKPRPGASRKPASKAPSATPPKALPEGEKAYKILALQERISHREAKALIDKGVVYFKNQRLSIARENLPAHAKLTLKAIEQPRVLFEDEEMLALYKPAFEESDALIKRYPGTQLIHRLDRETSGVLLLSKSEAFLSRCIEAFRTHKVYKEYRAWVEGVVSEPQRIDTPIATTKGTRAISRISKEGQSALTEIEPLELKGRRTLLKVVIHTGRTHQIRVHLKSIQHPILGDTLYGGKPHTRMLLHARSIALLGREITCEPPQGFDPN